MEDPLRGRAGVKVARVVATSSSETIAAVAHDGTTPDRRIGAGRAAGPRSPAGTDALREPTTIGATGATTAVATGNAAEPTAVGDGTATTAATIVVTVTSTGIVPTGIVQSPATGAVNIPATIATVTSAAEAVVTAVPTVATGATVMIGATVTTGATVMIDDHVTTVGHAGRSAATVLPAVAEGKAVSIRPTGAQVCGRSVVRDPKNRTCPTTSKRPNSIRQSAVTCSAWTRRTRTLLPVTS